MNLIEEIKGRIIMEIRENSQGSKYLEAVLNKKDLDSLISILRQDLGPAAKEFGREANLPQDIQEMVDGLGGLSKEQSFFYRREGYDVIYAALWPWQSNPDKITLKCGISGSVQS